MIFYSTKTADLKASLEEAIFNSLPPDNGLYMPESIPAISKEFMDDIENKSFKEIAIEVTATLLGSEITRSEIESIIDRAYDFEAPVVKITPNDYVLELFHGPSMAFKDFGARFMAAIMSYFLQRSNKEIRILVATSGDTGGAVAQGFYKVPGISVTILYPSGKVSDIQEKQLTTLGHNVTALEVEGTFDDCQRLVKEAFLDAELSEKYNLASANSINIARLIPQSFYYFAAYAQLKKLGKPLVFSVPSGNFGNLSAGVLAYRMGLPVEHFIAATNANNAVPRYLTSGTYEPLPSIETISNAMDVGSPSNFVRLTRFFNDDWNAINEKVSGAFYNDEQTQKAMREVFGNANYVMCPHTAVAYRGLQDYRKKTGSDFTGVFLSTAHPAKFIDLVEETLGKSIEVPERLKSLLDIEKVSIKMKPEFSEFKSLLMNALK
ncbi:threonine synthase [Dyadobacter fermentans]|uniref:Threonine synthase n=1 Tax=Dyadobacter fermentans (strain ATCC 700827 / DSM 18053 / CIP 107007 / KCTC 52180 / NS114) TaxID=471854 RepID=C6VWH9_DYAFD|nr:threonine synthase [Dyadobacter fermentans]ACT95010.1 threonine synthase [Dyadobacter fermentans DSM 18053]